MLNPSACARAQPDLRPRVGLRLRPGVERAAGVRRVSAAQAGGGGRAAADPYGAGGGVCCASRDRHSSRDRLRVARSPGHDPAHADRRGGGRVGRGRGAGGGGRAVCRGQLGSARGSRQGSARARARVDAAAARRCGRRRGRAGPRGGCSGAGRRARAGRGRAAGRRGCRAASSRRRSGRRRGTCSSSRRTARCGCRPVRAPRPRRSPSRPRDRAIAQSGSGSALSDRTVKGTKLRVLTEGHRRTRRGDGGAAAGRGGQRAEPAGGDPRDRRRGWDRAGGGAGRGVARVALAPVRRFTARTETLTEAGVLRGASLDLSRRLHVEGRDELGRLADSFNRTLDALERSVSAQRQLVADAGHELRTPIASLRANIQVLGEAERLPAADQESLRADIVAELDELTALVADVVELARGTASDGCDGGRGALGRGRAGGDREGAAARRGALRGRPGADGRDRAGRPDRPGRGESARERPQVEPGGWRRGGAAARRRAERARPRAGV